MATVDFFVNTDASGDGNGLTRSDTGVYWALSFDSGSTDPTGSTVEVNGATSNNGFVEKVILGSGTWAGGDAAGVMILSSKAGTFSNDQQLDINGGSTNIADTNIDSTAANFWSNRNEDAGAYNDMPTAEAGIDNYTDTGSDDMQVWCSGTSSDNLGASNVLWASITCNSLLIAGDDGSADGVVAYGNDGEYTGTDFWSTSHYRLTSSYTSGVFDIRVADSTTRRIQIECTGAGFCLALGTSTAVNNLVADGVRCDSTGQNKDAIRVNPTSGATGYVVRNCIARSKPSFQGVLSLSNCTIDVLNCMLYAEGASNSYAVQINSGCTVDELRNNVFIAAADDVLVSGTLTTSSNNIGDSSETESAQNYEPEHWVFDSVLTTNIDDDMSADGWTKGTGWSHDSGNTEYDKSTGTASDLTKLLDTACTAGKFYKVTVTFANRTASSCGVKLSGGGGAVTLDNSVQVNGTYSFYAVATHPHTTLEFNATSTWDGSVQDAKVEEMDFSILPRYSEDTAAPFANGTTTSLPSADVRGVSRGDGTFNSPDIGPYHLDTPTCYVNTDNVFVENGSSVERGHSTASEAEADVQAQCPDFPADNRTVTIQCSGTTADSPVNIGGITIDEDPYQLYIIGDNNTSGYSTSHYRLEDTGNPLLINNERVTGRALQSYRTSTSGAACSLIATNNTLERCYIRSADSSVSGAISVTASAGAVNISNCIVEVETSAAAGDSLIRTSATSGFTNLYNTLLICGGGTLPRGFRILTDLTQDIKGNVFCNIGSNNDLNGTTTNSTKEYNRGKDAEWTSGTGNAQWTVTTDDWDRYYPNYASRDFTPVYSDSVTGVYEEGESGASTDVPALDFAGTSRGDNTSANFVSDIGPIHLSDPIVYVNRDATGDGRDHANGDDTLANAEAAFQTHLADNNRNITVYCGCDTTATDTTEVTISGSTTALGNEITIAGDPVGANLGENTGTGFDTSYYHLAVTNGTNACLYIQDEYVNVTGLQIKNNITATSTTTYAIRWPAATIAASTSTIDRARIQVNNTAGDASSGGGIWCQDADVTLNLKNSVIENVGSVSADAGVKGEFADLNADNVVVAGGDSALFAFGFDRDAVPDNWTVANSVIFNCTDDLNQVTTITNCATEQGAGEGTSGQTVSDNDGTDMNEPTTGDYRPITGGVLDNNASGVPSGVDITGTTWALQNIGAFNDEVAASAGYDGNSTKYTRLIHGIGAGRKAAAVATTGAFSSTGTATTAFDGASIREETFSSSGTATSTFDALAIFDETFSSSGTATVAFTGTALFDETFSSSGTATVAFEALAVFDETFTASGTATTSFDALAIFDETFSSSGTATVAFSTDQTVTETFSATGTATSVFDGQSIHAETFSVSGTATTAFDGLTIFDETFSISGTATTSFAGIALFDETFTSSGTATVAFDALAIFDETFSSSGAATVAFDGTALIDETFTVSGTATVAFSSQQIEEGTFASTGTATSVFDGQSTHEETFTSSGTATSAFSGQSTHEETFASTGTATSVFDGQSVAEGTFAITGTATSSFSGQSTHEETFASIGTATSAFAGESTHEETFYTIGTATVTFDGVGATVAQGSFTITGAATTTFSEATVQTGAFSATGSSTFSASGTSIDIKEVWADKNLDGTTESWTAKTIDSTDETWVAKNISATDETWNVKIIGREN